MIVIWNCAEVCKNKNTMFILSILIFIYILLTRPSIYILQTKYLWNYIYYLQIMIFFTIFSQKKHFKFVKLQKKTKKHTRYFWNLFVKIVILFVNLHFKFLIPPKLILYKYTFTNTNIFYSVRYIENFTNVFFFFFEQKHSK